MVADGTRVDYTISALFQKARECRLGPSPFWSRFISYLGRRSNPPEVLEEDRSKSIKKILRSSPSTIPGHPRGDRFWLPYALFARIRRFQAAIHSSQVALGLCAK